MDWQTMSLLEWVQDTPLDYVDDEVEADMRDYELEDLFEELMK